MKNSTPLLTSILISTLSCFFQLVRAQTQPFSIEWQKFYGGSNTERNDYEGKTIAPTTGGGYLSTSLTLSDDLSPIGYHGGGDILAMKIDSLGNVQWQKCYGGSGDDEIHSVISTYDGGFLLMSFTNSADGDVPLNHGGYDLWLVKLDGDGNIQWQKSFGGSSDDFNPSGLQNVDGSFMITSFVFSTDGDVSGNHGDADIWLIKVDADGNLLWQRCYGGSSGDYVDGFGIIKTLDGEYALSGDVLSNDGDIAGKGFHEGGDPSFDDDEWLVKIDADGNIQWSKCYGGIGVDWFRYLTQFSNGDFIGTGTTYGSDATGDMPGSYGDFDWWIARISSTGDLIWSRHYGGSDQEAIHNEAFELSNGEFIISSGTNSHDDDVVGNTASKALWIVKMDPDGNIVNYNIFGSIGYNQNGGSLLNTDGTLITNCMIDTTNFAGHAEDVDSNADVWILKLDPVAVASAAASLYNSATGSAAAICTNAASVKLNLRINIPSGYISNQGVSVGLYKDGVLVATHHLGGNGYTSALGKTIYDNFTIRDNARYGDGRYKTKVFYHFRSTTAENYQLTNFKSNGLNIDFSEDCAAKMIAATIISGNELQVKCSPNPFSQSTVISFRLAIDENVSVKIFDVEGRLIRTLTSDVMSAGTHELTWDAHDESGNAVSPGIYFLKMQTANQVETIRLNVVK